jgi:hypothetical protein
MPRFFSRLGEVVRWYPADMSREERTLLSKIDGLVLCYACLAFFTKYLDVSALSEPYLVIVVFTTNVASKRLRFGNEGRSQSIRQQVELYQCCLYVRRSIKRTAILITRPVCRRGRIRRLSNPQQPDHHQTSVRLTPFHLAPTVMNISN